MRFTGNAVVIRIFTLIFSQLIPSQVRRTRLSFRITSMKMRLAIPTFFALCSTLFLAAPKAYGEFTCDVDLAYGIVVNKKQLRVMNESRTLVQINHKNQLFVSGKLVELDAKEQKMLIEYASGLHYVVPKMIVIATEGVDLAAETIEHVYLGLVGSDHDSYKKLHGAMKRVKMRVKEKYRYASGHYFIGPGSLESVDEFVDSEIEAQLEEAITTSVGGILSAVVGVDTNRGDNDDKVAEITRQLEAMGEQLERDVAPRANTLRKKAEWFCRKLEKLNKTEEALRKSVPELEPYNIITVD